MPVTPRDIAQLLVLRLSGELSDIDGQRLAEWETKATSHQTVARELGDDQQISRLVARRSQDKSQDIENRLLDRIQALIAGDQMPNGRSRSFLITAKAPHFHTTAWMRYAAAIILLLGIGAYYWIDTQHRPALTTTRPVSTENDILPGSNKAILTLSDGRKLELDSIQGRTYIADGDARIASNSGVLTYKGGRAAGINTMTTPKGGQYKIQLADGTRVWLNAASSITYPTAFNNNTREVNTTGEVYFEVARDKSKPFIVKSETQIVTVLGTSFNINAYSNEPVFKTTLLDGVINVNNQLIEPGQAYVNGKVSITNVQQDIAWKSGIFNFEGQDLKAIMRQIERWYDVQVKYEGNIPGFVFEGKMDKGVKLSGVIRFLQQYGLTVELKGKDLIVKQ